MNRMAVILRSADDHEYQCLQHNLVFKDPKAFKFHDQWCDKFVSARNLCTYSDSTGLMCAKEFKHVASLILHSYREHRQMLCVHCKGKFKSIKELERHRHTTKNAHERKRTVISHYFSKIKYEIAVLLQVRCCVHYVISTVRIEMDWASISLCVIGRSIERSLKKECGLCQQVSMPARDVTMCINTKYVWCDTVNVHMERL